MSQDNISVGVLVPAECIARVIGKAGHGLKQIREGSGCKVAVSDKGADPSALRRVDLIGQPHGISAAVSSVLHVISQGSGSIEASLLIPNALVGAVIGKAGANLKRIREGFGVRVQVEREPVANAGTAEQERMINVSGEAAAVGQALGMAFGSSGPAAAAGGCGFAGGGGCGGPGGGFPAVGAATEVQNASDDPEVVQIHIVIPGRITGAIVGKEGSTIKQLSTQAGCRITVSNRTASSDRKVVCIGAFSAVCKAQQMLDNLIQQAKMDSGIDADPNVNVNFWVPKGASGAIIGKGGATLGSIREQAQVKVNFGKEEVKGQRACTISGPLSNVIQAEELVYNLLAENAASAPQKRALALEGGGAAAKRPRTDPFGADFFGADALGADGFDQAWDQEPQSWQQQQQQMGDDASWDMPITPVGGKGGAPPNQRSGAYQDGGAGQDGGQAPPTKILIPARSAGAVIGKQGSGLARIRQECGVKLEMLKQEQAPNWPQDRVVQVHGPQENRVRAIEAVLQAAFESSPQANLKMLVSQKDAGAIIGKAGATLKSLREQSGCGCQVEKQEVCGERLVTASGPVAGLLALVVSIMGVVGVS